MELSELKLKIDYIIDNIYSREVNIYEEIKNIIPGINKQYENLIVLIPSLIEIGVEISVEGVISQLRALLTAVEQKNKVSIYDVLKYEIKDTIEFYEEIITTMSEED